MQGMYLDRNGDLMADFDLVSWVGFHNKSATKVKFGSLAREGYAGVKFSINKEAITRYHRMNQVGKISHLFSFVHYLNEYSLPSQIIYQIDCLQIQALDLWPFNSTIAMENVFCVV